MAKLIKKQEYVKAALDLLDKAIQRYQTAQKSPLYKFDKNLFDTEEELLQSLRDSMIQRFEFCVDLTWKLLKDYLEQIEKVRLDIKSPRSIFRAACDAKLINEQEG